LVIRASIALGMVCTCAPEDNHLAERLLAEVYERLSGGSARLQAHPVTQRTFLTDAMRSFHHDFGVTLQLRCEQTFAVLGTDNTGEVTIVKSDQAEHGVAALWRHYANNAGLH